MLDLEPLQVVVVTSLSEPDCDSDLESSLRAILRASKYLALTQLRIKCDEDRVVLSGDLDTYFLNQSAQEPVRPWILNRILSNECKIRG